MHYLVGVAHAFGTVRQSVCSVRRMAKRMLKEFEEVSEVSNTSPNTTIHGVLTVLSRRVKLVLVSMEPGRSTGMVVSQDGHALSLLR